MRKVLWVLIFALFSLEGLAKELTVIFGVSRPPFIKENPPSGISYDLFSVISERLGWHFNAQFAPNRRMQIAMADMQVDAIVEVQKNNSDIFYSAPFIAYRNFAVSRSRDQIHFTEYADLKGHSVCAWQNAKKHLGSRFENLIPDFQEYREFPHQEVQVRSWLSTECEVIIIDDTLLKWWVNKLAPSFVKRDRPVDTNMAFAPLPNNTLWWYVAFKNESLRDQFDSELKKIRSNGEYEAIREQVLLQERKLLTDP